MSFFAHFKIEEALRYLKDSPLSTVGTESLLMKGLGWNGRDRVEYFLIPKVTHLSTLIKNCAH